MAGKQVVRRHYSWPEFCDAVEANIPNLPSRHQEGTDWHWGSEGPIEGTSGTAVETLAIARGAGWQAAIPDAEMLMEKIQGDLGESMRMDFDSAFDVAGSEVDMGRFLSGEPECMRESVPMHVMRTG